ncbi:hypothetical protein EVB91_183 [Rhizobium phage RHph_I1_18]|nr:hypothetical protein EVB91_183 [Rhizobium phage RHph_I1_18]
MTKGTITIAPEVEFANTTTIDILEQICRLANKADASYCGAAEQQTYQELERIEALIAIVKKRIIGHQES